MSKDDSYWKGYIQKQNEAMEICKQCKYRKKANKYDSLVMEIKDKIEEVNNEKLNYSEDEYYLESEVKGYTMDKLQELLKEVEDEQSRWVV